jgi:penicillin-binding protein 1A
MHELNYIDDEQFKVAQLQPVETIRSNQEFAIKADYLSEMVRQIVFDKYQDDAYTQGFKVYTTIRQVDQLAAYKAVRKGVMDYDRRNGYRGPEGFVDLHNGSLDSEQLEEALQDIDDSDDLVPAIVLAASPTMIRAYTKRGETLEISGDGIRFAVPNLTKKAALNQRINPGSIIRLQKNEKDVWQISQLPQVQAAFVSGSPRDGAILSLIGGFDFGRNQFNHITQAFRQPGSSFKPFVYSASLEKGFTPATVINDAPITFDAEQTGSEPWEPKNYDGKFEGPMRMRQALIKSKNMVSIRILQSITPQYAKDYAAKFGFDEAKIPAYLTMALGAGSVTPLQMLAGYSVFANGGYSVTPYFIQRIEDARGTILSKATPTSVGNGAQQIIDPRNAFTMVSMMQDVVKHGTAIRAMQLGRDDLAGKTGTTNDSIDAWFCGFQQSVVGISWIGFDQPRSLGDKETGGGAALPMWISYMEKVLKDVPQAEYFMPENMVAMHINDSGLIDDSNARIEYFYQENVPSRAAAPAAPNATTEPNNPPDAVKDQLL